MTTRTLTQNAAMHKFFTLLADTLNEAGLETKKVLSNKWNAKVIHYLEEARKMLKPLLGTSGAPANVASGVNGTLNKCIGLLEGGDEVDIPWSAETVKDLLWRPIQIAMFNKESTTELDTHEVSEVHAVLNRHLSEKFGISVPFPSRDEIGGR